MKRFILFLVFVSTSTWAELPRSNAVVETGEEIARALVNKHFELVNPYCLKDQLLDDNDTLRSVIAAGGRVKSLSFKYVYNSHVGKNYVQIDANTSLPFSFAFSCELK